MFPCIPEDQAHCLNEAVGLVVRWQGEGRHGGRVKAPGCPHHGLLPVLFAACVEGAGLQVNPVISGMCFRCAFGEDCIPLPWLETTALISFKAIQSCRSIASNA